MPDDINFYEEIIGYVAAMCQGDPLQLAKYLVGLMMWTGSNTIIIAFLVLRINILEKAIEGRRKKLLYHGR